MKIICLGDSNTYGYDPRDFWGGHYDRPWPQILEEKTGSTVINLGENGRQIPVMTSQINWIDRCIAMHQPADLLIILLGSNDALNIPVNQTEIIETRMDNYLTHLRKSFPDLSILLLAPMTITMYGPDIRKATEAFPAIYKHLADKHGIRYADTAEWKLPIAYDGLHLTEEAHAIFAERIGQLLDEGTIL